MSLVEESLKQAIAEYLPARLEDYNALSMEELLTFIDVNLAREHIEALQCRFHEILSVKHHDESQPIPYAEFDDAVPLPKTDELEDPRPYSRTQAGPLSKKDDE